jgi:hypothetical protein
MRLRGRDYFRQLAAKRKSLSSGSPQRNRMNVVFLHQPAQLEDCMSDREPLRIIAIDRLQNELVVGYSDKTTAIYGIEQLITLSPKQTLSSPEEKVGNVVSIRKVLRHNR